MWPPVLDMSIGRREGKVNIKNGEVSPMKSVDLQ